MFKILVQQITEEMDKFYDLSKARLFTFPTPR